MKIHQSVQKLLVGETDTHTHTHTHTKAGDLISLLSFFESRLQTKINTKINKGEQSSIGIIVISENQITNFFSQPERNED
jgi:hypothetical protein